MHDFVQSLIRTSAFLRREIFEILRQPRLLITLVLGPFLILLIFGIGYRNDAPPVRTLFVLPEDSSITPEEIEEYATTLGPSLSYAGMTRDKSEALERLRQGEVEMVAIAPAQIYETLLSGKQAMFTIYHSELDPAQANYVSYFSRIYIEEVNRRVLQRVALRGQQDARSIQARLREAKAQIAILRGALESNDIETARRQIALLLAASGEMTTLTSAAGISLLDNLEQQLSPDEYHRAEAILEYVADFEERLQDLDSNLESAPTDVVNLEEVDAIEKDIDRLQAQLEEFTRIESYVLVKPFAIDTQNVAPLQPEVVEYFAPAVIVLLLQHLATSFASLSIVQEQSVGTMELFRVSPLSAGETLLGKYLSYMLFGGVVGMGLTLLLVLVLKIPMLGNWGSYLLILAALLFTSLSVGFVISLVSETDSQAVQYTMIVLLMGVFFSGFLLRLEALWKPVRVLSWALPTTYGIRLLRQVMLAGAPLDLQLLGGLIAIGLALFGVAWWLLHGLIEIG